MTKEEKQVIAQQALTRATSGQTLTNYPDIYRGFMARGIPENDIKPRENVFTFHAWRALGRTVRRGEHGIKIISYVPMTKIDPADGERKPIGCKPTTAVVFHVSQTDPLPA